MMTDKMAKALAKTNAAQKRTQSHKKKKFLKNLKDGFGIVSYACELTNVSRQTYYKWRNTDPEFQAECDDIKENTVDTVESKLFSAIAEGNITAIIFYLKTHAKDRGYIETIDTNVNVNRFEQLMKKLPDEFEDDLSSD